MLWIKSSDLSITNVITLILQESDLDFSSLGVKSLVVLIFSYVWKFSYNDLERLFKTPNYVTSAEMYFDAQTCINRITLFWDISHSNHFTFLYYSFRVKV